MIKHSFGEVMKNIEEESVKVVKLKLRETILRKNNNKLFQIYKM